MIKTAQQKADDSTFLVKTLLQRMSYAEAGVTVAGALFMILEKHHLSPDQSLEEIGRLFSTMYVEEDKGSNA